MLHVVRFMFEQIKKEIMRRHVHESKLVLEVVLGIGLTGALSVSVADGVCAMMSSLPISRKAFCSSACVAGRSPLHSHELMVA